MKQISCLLFFLILISACTGNQTKDLNNDVVKEIQSTGEIKSFVINAFRFGFDPDAININLGDTVRLTINSLDVPHGLAIPDFGVNIRSDRNEKTAEFIADKKGTFPFYCSIPCGSGHKNMQGVLIIS